MSIRAALDSEALCSTYPSSPSKARRAKEGAPVPQHAVEITLDITAFKNAAFGCISYDC